MDKDHLGNLEALREKGIQFIRGGNVFDDTHASELNYQDSEDANNPPYS